MLTRKNEVLVLAVIAAVLFSFVPPSISVEKEQALSRKNNPVKAAELESIQTEDISPKKESSKEVSPVSELHEKDEEFLKWLEKNYPKEAEKLEKVINKDSKQDNTSGDILGTYGKIFEVSKSNPKLAKLLKKDLALTKKRDKILDQIKSAKEKEKQKLIKKLEKILTNRYELILQRKQLAYEQLHKKLEILTKKVKKRAAEVENWKETEIKEENVKVRLEELIGKAEDFRWY